jgi:DNA-3-methyladenine glycosylase
VHPEFYARPVLEVARDLIGCTVYHGDGSGIIVETEAYHHAEPACHAYVGLTPRTSTLFGPAGLAYVYRSYGLHALLNAVCESEQVGAAVLIRALEPLDGIESMRARRGAAGERHLEDLCSGPGKLSQALGIDVSLNATSLDRGPIRIGPRADELVARRLVTGARVGITRALELPWRFCLAGSRFVSRPWPEGLSETVGRRA